MSAHRAPGLFWEASFEMDRRAYAFWALCCQGEWILGGDEGLGVRIKAGSGTERWREGGGIWHALGHGDGCFVCSS